MNELRKIPSILYVEDEKNIQEELSEVLSLFCETLYVADNGEAGLELYKAHSPVLVISDINMPIMNGIEMSKMIKQLNKETHILFTTAFSDLSYMQEAITLQVDGYLIKPLNLDMLEQMIQKIIRIYSLEEELNRKNNKLNEYLKLIDENIITSSTNLQGIITDVSTAFCEVTGYTKEELVGSYHNITRHKDMPKELYEELWESIEKNQTWEGEIKNKTKSGDAYWVHAKIYPIYDEKNQKIGYTSIRRDITNFKKLEELSIKDGLTDIYNRRYFNDFFPKFVQAKKRNNELVSFAMLDIDYFKQYNDSYGHKMGDDALIAVAKSIDSTLQRADDYFFRLGGEEFGILFKADTKEKSLDLLNMIVENIENLQIPHKSSEVSAYLTLSVGLVSTHAKSITSEEALYIEADDLLYRAKQNGRNRVEV